MLAVLLAQDQDPIANLEVGVAARLAVLGPPLDVAGRIAGRDVDHGAVPGLDREALAVGVLADDAPGAVVGPDHDYLGRLEAVVAGEAHGNLLTDLEGVEPELALAAKPVDGGRGPEG